MKARYILLLLVFAGSCICPRAIGAPEPAVVQEAEEWTLDVQAEPLKHISVRLGKKQNLRHFWYLIVSATNNTGQEVGFYPHCELMTDTFQVIPAGNDVPLAVFQQIKERHKSEYPFLESLERVDNKVLQGENNTKDIAIIWSDFEAKAKDIKLFIAGLSNETAVVEHPVETDKGGQPLKVFLRKTLQMNYSIGGDPTLRGQQKISFKGEQWVMR